MEKKYEITKILGYERPDISKVWRFSVRLKEIGGEEVREARWCQRNTPIHPYRLGMKLTLEEFDNMWELIPNSFGSNG